MELTNPHDRFFKEVFSRRENARDFLQHYLPPELRSQLDLSTLEISKDSFIDPELQEHFSDLLYKIARRDGGETYIYVLFEHKSYPDPFIAFQLLRYMVRIWEQSLKQNQKLLPVLPIVMYHGQAKWHVSLNFAALFDLPEEMKPFVPDYQYWLCDLTQYSDEEIKGEVTLRVALLLLKYILSDELKQRLGQILALLQTLSEQKTGLQYLETILRYLSGGTDKISASELEQVVTEVFTKGEKLMPTIAEQWIEQGLEQGLAIGREQGWQQGRQEGYEEGREAALMLLRRFLKYRFGVALDHFDDDLHPLDLATLTQLSDRAFEVENLAEFEAVLADLAVAPKE